MMKPLLRRAFLFLILLLRAVSPIAAAAGEDRRPNILLLITDDQDVLLGGIEHMPILQREIAAQGVSFRHAFVHTPICCPSRSSILVSALLRYFVACLASNA